MYDIYNGSFIHKIKKISNTYQEKEKSKTKDIHKKKIDVCIMDYDLIDYDLKDLWKELKEVCHKKTAYFFIVNNTIEGIKLINSNLDYFKYDIIIKCKDLEKENIHKPIRNHKYMYVFYEEQPHYYYDRNHSINLIKNKYEPPLKKSIIEFNNNIDIYKFIINYYTKENDNVLCNNLNDSFIIYCLKNERNIIAAAHEENNVFFDKINKYEKILIQEKQKDNFKLKLIL